MTRLAALRRLAGWQWGTLVTATMLVAGMISASVLFGLSVRDRDAPVDAALRFDVATSPPPSSARPAGSAPVLGSGPESALNGPGPHSSGPGRGSAGPYTPLRAAGGTASPLRVSADPAGGVPVVQDPLNAPGLWLDSEDPAGRASCVTRGTLRVTREDRGVYRCVGPARQLTDGFSVAVNTTLETPGSCAAIWFRFSPERGGQVLRICADRVEIAVDRPDDKRVLGELPLATPIPPATTTRVRLLVRGGTAQVSRDGTPLGTVPLGTPPSGSPGGPSSGPAAGQVALGISIDTVTDAPPYTVTFANVDMRTVR